MLTTLQLHQLFDFEIDKEHTQDAPSFHPLTKDKFINLAIDTFVKTRYEKLDLTEKNREEIAPFVTEQTFTPNVVSNTLLAYDLGLLQPAHWYTVKLLGVQNKECENPYIEIRPEKHDNVFHRLNNPFKKPKPDKCFYTIQDTKLIQIYKHTDSVINEIKIWYVKQFVPANIIAGSVTDITPQIVHDIISIAVRFALEQTLSQRIQTYPVINNNRIDVP